MQLEQSFCFFLNFLKNCSQCICRGDGVVNQHHTVNPESKKIWDAVFKVYKTRMTMIYSLGSINSLINSCLHRDEIFNVTKQMNLIFFFCKRTLIGMLMLQRHVCCRATSLFLFYNLSIWERRILFVTFLKAKFSPTCP